MDTNKTQLPPSVAVSYTGIGVNGDGIMGKANIDKAYIQDAFNELVEPLYRELREKQDQINQLKTDLEDNDKIIETMQMTLITNATHIESLNMRVTNLSMALDYSVTEIYKEIFKLPYYQFKALINKGKNFFRKKVC